MPYFYSKLASVLPLPYGKFPKRDFRNSETAINLSKQKVMEELMVDKPTKKSFLSHIFFIQVQSGHLILPGSGIFFPPFTEFSKLL
jgi:hypothetical protein